MHSLWRATLHWAVLSAHCHLQLGRARCAPSLPCSASAHPKVCLHCCAVTALTHACACRHHNAYGNTPAGKAGPGRPTGAYRCAFTKLCSSAHKQCCAPRDPAQHLSCVELHCWCTRQVCQLRQCRATRPSAGFPSRCCRRCAARSPPARELNTVRPLALLCSL